MNRRGFLRGLISAIAAPAIVKTFNIPNFVPFKGFEIEYGRKNLLTIDMITREAIELFMNSNEFIKNINEQYDEQFKEPFKIGSTLRIKLPKDYNA